MLLLHRSDHYVRGRQGRHDAHVVFQRLLEMLQVENVAEFTAKIDRHAHTHQQSGTECTIRAFQLSSKSGENDRLLCGRIEILCTN